jgi:uncharacterized iron-regulated protein
MFATVTLILALAQAAPQGSSTATPAPPPSAPAVPSAYVPERVYDTSRRAFTDLEAMIADLAKADVVFVGEQHDDPNTHKLELALLDGLRRRTISPIVSLEMFERDVQPLVDRYLAGSADEVELLKSGRPWPRYATDYRALVELAKAQGWKVVAANVPRRLASEVAKTGPDAIDRLPQADRELLARERQCPQDAYFDRFTKAMGGHGGDAKKADGDGAAAKPDPAAVEKARQQEAATLRYYWSQCIKDETMAESIARALETRTASGPLVHFTGAFHSDFTQGTAERTRRRLPGRRIVVLSMLPVQDLDTVAPAGDELKRADYLVYTIK